jgi:hypothetical protein
VLSYPAAVCSAGVFADEAGLPAEVTVAVRLCDLVSPLGNGARLEAGDLGMVPWSKRWRPAPERACLDWRKALGPAPLQELQAAVLAAAGDEHRERDGQSVTIGRARPLAAHSADGSLARVPDTPANRAAFGSVGTADVSAAWPSVRLYPLNNCFTRSLLAMPWGPAGSDKAAAEQRLLDAAMREFPHVLTMDRIWLLDRLWHDVRRMKELAALTHVLVRLKSDIALRRISEILPDGSYRAEISGDGVTMEVRVIEYYAEVEGQEAEEMFCLITSLLDWEDYPAIELARLYKWRWDGSETALREAKAPLHGAGPGTGAMLRSGSPLLIAQEIGACQIFCVSRGSCCPFVILPRIVSCVWVRLGRGRGT